MKKYQFKIKNLWIIVICSTLITMSYSPALSAQTVLSADGKTDTYKLINSVLAPGGNAVETPDCSHEEFGNHIDQLWDDALGAYVFRFYIHVAEDNDRCKNYDRQRNEIKTYDKSPDKLKATVGETVEYKWKFKLDSAFQTSSSFTHLHQIKAVGGSEEGMPLITLTARSTQKLQIRYAKNLTQETIHEVSLTPFLGQWVEATERILFGEEGSYTIEIKRISDGMTVLSYTNDNLRMWKTDADFLRPKWGIYRSLNNWEDLRDEILLFNDFSIEEIDASTINTVAEDRFVIHPNPSDGLFVLVAEPGATLDVFDLNGKRIHTIANVPVNKSLDFSLQQGTYLVSLHYLDKVLTERLMVN